MIDFANIQKSFEQQLKSYSLYRLADCIRKPNNKFCKFYANETCSEYHYRLWPDSLAGRYSFLNNFEEQINLKLLAEIITGKYGKPYYDMTSMHLRVGDAINTHVTKCKGIEPIYYLDKKWIENDSKSVALVFGCHNFYSLKFRQALTEKYILTVFNGLQALTEKPVFLKTTATDPDADFVFLLFSRYYVPSKGGWTHLLNPLRSMLL